VGLFKELVRRMAGDARRVMLSIFWSLLIGISVHFFTIHHPFVLSDNRHYTFYVWKRILFVHPLMPYALSPIYLACWWAWWIRAGSTQSFLQTLVLPLALLPTLLPSPLLEPRYFIVPYILLRLQVSPFNVSEAAVPNQPHQTSATTAKSTIPSFKRGTVVRPMIDWAQYLPWIELIWYAAINYVTMYMFLYKERTVTREHGEEIIRFMW